LESNIIELLNGLRGVLESDLTPIMFVSDKKDNNSGSGSLHLKQTLLLGLNTLKERGVWELEPVVLGGFKGIVRLGLWDSLDESLKVTPVSPELEPVQVKNIGDGIVKEGRVVRDDD
jgi:hypothetical protein